MLDDAPEELEDELELDVEVDVEVEVAVLEVLWAVEVEFPETPLAPTEPVAEPAPVAAAAGLPEPVAMLAMVPTGS